MSEIVMSTCATLRPVILSTLLTTLSRTACVNCCIGSPYSVDTTTFAIEVEPSSFELLAFSLIAYRLFSYV